MNEEQLTKAQAWDAVQASITEVYVAHGVPQPQPCPNEAMAKIALKAANLSGDFVSAAVSAVRSMQHYLSTGTKFKGTLPPFAPFFEQAVSSATEIWYALQAAASSPEYSVVSIDARPSACQWGSLEHRVLRHTGLTPNDILDDKNMRKFCAIYDMAAVGVVVLPDVGPKPAPKALPAPPQPKIPATIAALYGDAIKRGYTGTDGQWTLAQLHQIIKIKRPKSGAEMQILADEWMANPVVLVVLP